MHVSESVLALFAGVKLSVPSVPTDGALLNSEEWDGVANVSEKLTVSVSPAPPEMRVAQLVTVTGPASSFT